MLTAIVILLGLIVALLFTLVEVVICRWVAGNRQPPEGTVSPPAVPPTSGKEAHGPTPYPLPEGGAREGDGPSDMTGEDEAARKMESFERLWREGMDAMMGYDMHAAINAVRGDRGEAE